jgi:hypothetical protein
MAIHEGFQGVCIVHPLGVSIVPIRFPFAFHSQQFGRGKDTAVGTIA